MRRLAVLATTLALWNTLFTAPSWFVQAKQVAFGKAVAAVRPNGHKKNATFNQTSLAGPSSNITKKSSLVEQLSSYMNIGQTDVNKILERISGSDHHFNLSSSIGNYTEPRAERSRQLVFYGFVVIVFRREILFILHFTFLDIFRFLNRVFKSGARGWFGIIVKSLLLAEVTRRVYLSHGKILFTNNDANEDSDDVGHDNHKSESGPLKHEERDKSTVGLQAQLKKVSRPILLILILALSSWMKNPMIPFFASPLISGLQEQRLPIVQCKQSQHFAFEHLNQRYLYDSISFKRSKKQARKLQQNSSPRDIRDYLFSGDESVMIDSMDAIRYRNEGNDTVVVLDWTNGFLDSDIRSMNVVRDQASFLLRQSSSEDKDSKIDEIVVLVESPGGSVMSYSLAAEQLLRLREAGIRLTICVDKIAASGGYMIACTADPGQLFASPLAMVGSIGVIGQSINVRKVLEGWGVHPIVFRGGKEKAPLTAFDNITEEGKMLVQKNVDLVHLAFIRHVVECRPAVKPHIECISTGDSWLAQDAQRLGLIDELTTSDQYLSTRMENDGADVYKLQRLIPPKYSFLQPHLATSAAFDNVVRREKTGLTVILRSLKRVLEAFSA